MIKCAFVHYGCHYRFQSLSGFCCSFLFPVSIPLLLSIPFLDSIAYLDSVAVFSSALMCCFVEYREVFNESVWWKLFKNVIRSNIKSRILADCFMACTRNSLKETNGICATRQADYSSWQHSSTRGTLHPEVSHKELLWFHSHPTDMSFWKTFSCSHNWKHV